MFSTFTINFSFLLTDLVKFEFVLTMFVTPWFLLAKCVMSSPGNVGDVMSEKKEDGNGI